MEHEQPNLGLCFFGNRLFYAIGKSNGEGTLDRVGSVDFNFDVPRAILAGHKQHFPGIHNTVTRIKEEFGINHIRVHSQPSRECWTVMPKIVYDEPDEREDHINILMHGRNRRHIEPTWYTLSNEDYKFLLLRDRTKLRGFEQLASSASTTDLVSDFELGERWEKHSATSGSFMTLCVYEDCLSISSFILGNLRGATYITFDQIEDLPYLWLQHARELGWMQGLHEQIYLYGKRVYRLIEILAPFWDDAADVIKMDSLDKMMVNSDEQTYGFDLAQAFPAILLAL